MIVGEAGQGPSGFGKIGQLVAEAAEGILTMPVGTRGEEDHVGVEGSALLERFVQQSRTTAAGDPET